MFRKFISWHRRRKAYRISVSSADAAHNAAIDALYLRIAQAKDSRLNGEL